MKRKSILIFSSMLMLSSMISMNSVYADTEDDKSVKLEIATVDTELNKVTQKHIKSSPIKLANINLETMKFIKEVAPEAYASGEDYGIYPSIIIAQAVLESSNGTSGLSVAPYNNLFGMKGFYEGSSVQMRTKEDDGTGNMYTVYAHFKKYPDKSASIRDHGRLLREGLNGFYYGTWRENASSPAEAANYLQGRYATDTSYASKLMAIIESYNLERFDKELTERDFSWLASESLDPWELPIVEGKIEKTQTWGSGSDSSGSRLNYGEYELNKNLRDTEEFALDLTDETENYNKRYVKESLGLKDNFASKNSERFKEDPKFGDIATYSVENSDNQMIERYAIVEGVEKDSMLISEGIKGADGIHVIYRTISKKALDKFEFINTDKLKGFDVEEDDIVNLDNIAG